MNQEHPIHTSLNHLFHDTCLRFHQRIAYEHAGTTLSFEKLHDAATALATQLIHLGLRPGMRVGVMLPNCLQHPIAIFGTMLAGGIVVNLNPLLTERELKNQLIDSGCQTIIILDYVAFKLEACLAETQLSHVIISQIGDCFPKHKALLAHMVLKYIKKLGPAHQLKDTHAFADLISHQQEHIKLPNVQDSNIAFLQYTGGTTGTPKAAILTHRNILYNITQGTHAVKPELFTEKSQSTILLALPLYHIFALTVSIISFSHGAKGLLVTNPKDTKKLLTIIRSQPIHGMALIQTLMNQLLIHEDFDKVDWSHLRQTINGGMKTHQMTARLWHQRTGCLVDEGYGLSETSPIIAISSHQHSFSETVGSPVLHTLVKVMKDPNTPAMKQEAGEIWVKGPQVMAGYWHQPEETHHAMTPDGWFKTGDIGLINPQGEIKLIDREKDMIIVSGFNVYPQEVEEVINSHPQVTECGVRSHGSKTAEIVAAYIVPGSTELTIAEILKHCRENLTAYKVPKKIIFVSTLPKSAVGKVLRRHLPAA